MPQAALRWVLDQQNTSVVLSGAKNKAELDDAIIASAAAPYTTEELTRAEELHERDFSAA